MSLLTTVGTLITKALPWVSAGIGLLSTVKQYQGAKAIEKEGAFNRAVFDDEAAAAWRSYEDRASILREQHRIENAAARANYAKSGVTLSGSPMVALLAFKRRQEADERALYNTAVAGDRQIRSKGAMAEWQAINTANSVRSQALGNFGASLLSTAGRISYATPWTSADDDKLVAETPTARATKPRYTRSQANAVPGGRGWRPMGY